MDVTVFPLVFFPRVPLLYLQTVVGGAVRTLKVMHGSLDRSVVLSAGMHPEFDQKYCTV